MINLLFDYQAFDMQKFGGISRYFYNINTYLNLHNDFQSDISVVASNNYYLNKDYNYNFLSRSLLNIYPKINKQYSKWNVSKNNFDIFHPTYYHPYFLNKLQKPFVLTIHDMIHEKYPYFFAPYDPSIPYKKLLAEKATRIIAISESTKKDILEFYPKIDEDKIDIIHHGYNSIKQANHNSSNLKLPERYILFLGDRTGYKNFYHFLNAFDLVCKTDKDLQVICVGQAFNPMEEAFINLKNINDKIKQIRVSDNELFNVYKNAQLFVFPSLCEGFGLPILEAFEAECPLLLSDIECFREIAGDAAHYFNPMDYHDLSEKIIYVLQDKDRLEALKEKGRHKLSIYSMTDCISKTIKVYQSI